MSSTAPTAAEVQEALAKVLARPEFAERRPTGLAAWLARLREELGALFASWLERLHLVDLAPTTLLWSLRVWLVVAAVLLVAHLVTTLAGVRRGRLRAAAPRADARADAVGAPVDWSAAASRAAEAGHFREAVLALYQGLLLRLQRGGAIRYDPAKTPGDYRRELRPHPQLARALDAFLRLFEPVAFGGREPDRAAFERLSALARETAGD